MTWMNENATVRRPAAYQDVLDAPRLAACPGRRRCSAPRSAAPSTAGAWVLAALKDDEVQVALFEAVAFPSAALGIDQAGWASGGSESSVPSAR